MELDRYLTNLEKELMLGKGRWVADFNESFRHYPIADVTFDMVVTGKMRSKGFLLSRLVNFLLMPNYFAACLVYGSELDSARARKLLKIASDYAEREELRWVWLVLAQSGDFPRKIRSLLDSLAHSQNLGVALVNLEAEEVTCSESYLGRKMRGYVGCFR
mgnify:CR=1 FL=1